MFPTVPCVQYIIDTFCILSLTHRMDSFVTMLAPLRNHFLPKDPLSAPLLLTTKAQYLTRLALIANTHVDGDLEFSETQWVVSERTNVEHLLDVFTSLNTESKDVLGLIGRTVLQFIRLRHNFTTLRG